jgi:DNA-binding NarL/FixJ family response regulator
MLEGEPDLEIVGEAEDGQEALELCRRLRPDLVLMDVRMPKMDGLEATYAIKRDLPRIVVLMVTTHENPDYLLEALKAGAGGYVLKEVSQRRMTEEVRRALDGEPPINQGLAKQLIMRLADRMQEEYPADSTPASMPLQERQEPLLRKPLTPREAEVLQLMVQGDTNREIARHLSVAVNTVKNHVQRIIAKLEVSDRTQAAVRAIEFGLVRERRKRDIL